MYVVIVALNGFQENLDDDDDDDDVQ